jgi:hypothetical protein
MNKISTCTLNALVGVMHVTLCRGYAHMYVVRLTTTSSSYPCTLQHVALTIKQYASVKVLNPAGNLRVVLEVCSVRSVNSEKPVRLCDFWQDESLKRTFDLD